MSDPSMGLRALGSTGLMVTRVGLGLAALGRPGYINLGRRDDLGADRSAGAMERRCHQMLDAAYAAGVRYIDTARSYGLAEAFLASWLSARGLEEGAIAVGSKWGYTYVGDWRLDAPTHEVKDLSVQALRRQIGESRALLGRRLQLYQVHSATLESGVLQDQRVLEELTRLRSEGLAIGLTVTGPQQAGTIRRALDVHVGGLNPFQAVQATWNLLEPSAGPAGRSARARMGRDRERRARERPPHRSARRRGDRTLDAAGGRARHNCGCPRPWSRALTPVGGRGAVRRRHT